MAMGRKAQQRRQERFWVASTDLPRTVAHPFYEQLNRLLEEGGFDGFVEQQCGSFYAERMGRPSLSPGCYFRLLLMGYFEGIDSERGMAWRAADSLGLRKFLSLQLEEMVPDHSTISRTRRLIDVETHQAVFRWVLELLAKKGLGEFQKMQWPRLLPYITGRVDKELLVRNEYLAAENRILRATGTGSQTAVLMRSSSEPPSLSPISLFGLRQSFSVRRLTSSFSWAW